MYLLCTCQEMSTGGEKFIFLEFAALWGRHVNNLITMKGRFTENRTGSWELDEGSNCLLPGRFIKGFPCVRPWRKASQGKDEEDIMLSLSVVSDSLRAHGLLSPTRLLCPRDSPGKNTGVGCHSLSRGSSWPRDQSQVCIASRFFTLWATGKFGEDFNNNDMMSNIWVLGIRQALF